MRLNLHTTQRSIGISSYNVKPVASIESPYKRLLQFRIFTRKQNNFISQHVIHTSNELIFHER